MIKKYFVIISLLFIKGEEEPLPAGFLSLTVSDASVLNHAHAGQPVLRPFLFYEFHVYFTMFGAVTRCDSVTYKESQNLS